MSDAVRDARANARKGDPVAMIMLAEWYHAGLEGLDKSQIKSFEWMLRAAEHGHFEAQNIVGGAYEMGDGVAKDSAKAIEWYEKAYGNGSPEACFNLGLIYEDGVLAPQDLPRSIQLYEEGVSRGSTLCQFRLGYKYLFGDSVNMDIARGMELLSFAGEGGYGSAYETLGTIHLGGMLVPRNPERAYDYFMRALTFYEVDARIATGNAPLLLALCLLTGTGCAKDRKGALEILEGAAEAGNVIAEQVVRTRMVRDPMVYMLFAEHTMEKPLTMGWDVSTLMLSKFA